MEKREFRVGICDGKAEDIRHIEDALRKELERMGQPVQLTCHCFMDGGTVGGNPQGGVPSARS